MTTLGPGMVGAYYPPPAGHSQVVLVLGVALALLDEAFAGKSCAAKPGR